MINKNAQYRKQVRDFARKLYAYLKENCIGRELSTTDLVFEAFPPIPLDSQDSENVYSDISFFPSTDEELIDVDYALGTIVAQGHKYEMDGDHYAHQDVGLPHYIPYIFRLKNDKHPIWDGLVPFFNEGQSYLKWLRKCDEYVFYSSGLLEYLQRLKEFSYSLDDKTPITEKDLEEALMESQVSGDMIDIVLDPQNESKCRIEFVSRQEYHRRYPEISLRLDF